MWRTACRAHLNAPATISARASSLPFRPLSFVARVHVGRVRPAERCARPNSRCYTCRLSLPWWTMIVQHEKPALRSCVAGDVRCDARLRCSKEIQRARDGRRCTWYLMDCERSGARADRATDRASITIAARSFGGLQASSCARRTGPCPCGAVHWADVIDAGANKVRLLNKE